VSGDAFPNLRVVRHPVLAHAIAALRDAGTPRAAFRAAMARASALLAGEAARDLPVAHAKRSTPVGRAEVEVLADEPAAVVPILRAGLGMLGAFLDLLPGAAVGFLGIERDARTREPREYYAKLPPDAGGRVFVIDPTIATGGSASHALDRIRATGVAAGRIRLVALFAAPEGVRRLLERHPEVRVLVAERLDDEQQIVPGLGDAGDRLYGTEQGAAAGRTPDGSR